MASQPLSLALKSNRAGWSWGLNNFGQLGLGDTANRSSPVLVVGSHAFTKIALGSEETGIALKVDGSAWAWGKGSAGQLGQGTTIADRSSPVAVIGSHVFDEVIQTGSHSHGLKSNGECWSWGDNGYGQLGDNSRVHKSSPVLVVGSHAFTEISGGEHYGVAIKSNGECWAWGMNLYGQLGQSDAVSRSSPVLVVGSHAFTKIEAGRYHILALKEDGECWSWGSAYEAGELGDGAATSRSSPVLVVGSHNFVEISGGWSHSLGLKSNGECWAWGNNNAGQLGSDTVESKSSPIQVVGSHAFIEISAGYHSLGLKDNGEVWAWGVNSAGQLGLGDTANRSSPVLVVGSHVFETLHEIEVEGEEEAAENAIFFGMNF